MARAQSQEIAREARFRNEAGQQLMQCLQVQALLEREHVQAVVEYLDAKKVADGLRARIGPVAIARALPFIKRIQEQQVELAAVQRRHSALEEDMRSSKILYSDSLAELDQITQRVHVARQDFEARTAIH